MIYILLTNLLNISKYYLCDNIESPIFADEKHDLTQNGSKA